MATALTTTEDTTATQGRTTNPDLRTAPMPLDLFERDDALLVIASLPGVHSEDLDIRLEGDRLTVTADRHEPIPAGTDDAVATPLFRELGSVRWTRAVRLRTPVDADAINAKLENGMLQLTMPKAPEARPRAIEVNVG
ncbi:MAG: Hsp20/alpha crystallin family protein [Oligoflexia bacterium]|nr:Hsp20/alpha crystallin family protein [Oligoflexia bacterium]